MCSRAALDPLAGLMRPAGRVFEVPELEVGNIGNYKVAFYAFLF
jgi:hypothetical protein